MEHQVMKHKRTTMERIEKFISPIYFTDVNLYGRLYPKRKPIENIRHFAAPGRITYEEAIKAYYKPVKVGQSFGPVWSTHWFCLEVTVPEAWISEEVYLLWKSGSEAMVWQNGEPMQGLSEEHNRIEYRIDSNTSPVTLYIEMACNTLFGAGNGLINPPDENRTFNLSKVDIVTRNQFVYHLLRDFDILLGMVQHIPDTDERGYEALYVANKMVNICLEHTTEAYKRAISLSKTFFAERNGDTYHTLHAIGNCHIDTAWLWPYAETIRKCARSWSTTLNLMRKFPNFKFACSQAQQLQWVKEYYPDLFLKIKCLAKQDRFIPVGGTWVEMDCNIPNGESLLRQFLYGQQFFKKEFDTFCPELWLPDTFGYSVQLPQIMSLCGINKFVTQKLSWNLVNKFPHHTFWWEGLDGTSVLTHFPPGDSYEMSGTVEEVLKSVKNHRDKGRVSHSLYLFGHGDGGNGPDENMLERLTRLEDVSGMPKVHMSSPSEFFDSVCKEDTSMLCKWKGELYVELHNGTYTTHAMMKQYNRQLEFVLYQTEFICSVAMLQHSHYIYPQEELCRLWKLLLLNQFHDVIPGTSINMVYQDSVKHYDDILSSCKKLCLDALQFNSDTESKRIIVVNTLTWHVDRVVTLPEETYLKDYQMDHCQNKLVLCSCDCLVNEIPHCAVSLDKCKSTAYKDDKYIYMENEEISVKLDFHGRITSLKINGNEKEFILPNKVANQFVMFDDVPLYWDAWDVMDYHLETRKPIQGVDATIVDSGPIRSTVKVHVTISESSYIDQKIILDSHKPYVRFETTVTWKECHKFLKVEFPFNLVTAKASYETQFGFIERPTHSNTSWDTARFEVCGHKWADLSEYGNGVAILNHSKYGYSAFDNVMRLSLLRSSKSPDPKADMGRHIFSYAVMPHKGSLQESGVIRQAYNFNYYSPYYIGRFNLKDFLKVDTDQVIISAVKKSERYDRVVLLRLYESFGGYVRCNVTTGSFQLKKVKRCNGLEYEQGEDAELDKTDSGTDFNIKLIDGYTIQIDMAPFKIINMLLYFA